MSVISNRTLAIWNYGCTFPREFIWDAVGVVLPIGRNKHPYLGGFGRYRQYQYNTDLAPTQVQLQGMTMGSNEGFKEYAQKWRDLAGRVQPPLTDRELVDIFMGTLTGYFFNHLIGSSFAGFTELILTGEWVENWIRSGKIQGATSSDTQTKPYNGKKLPNFMYG